jgi:hypothetical protein
MVVQRIADVLAEPARAPPPPPSPHEGGGGAGRPRFA